MLGRGCGDLQHPIPSIGRKAVRRRGPAGWPDKLKNGGLANFKVKTLFGHLHSIHGKLDVHIAFHLAPSAGVDEFLSRLGNDGVTIMIEPVDHGMNRRIFLILIDGRIVERADESSPALEFLEETLVIDLPSVLAVAKRLAPSIKRAILLERVDILWSPAGKAKRAGSGARRHNQLHRRQVSEPVSGHKTGRERAG